MNARRKQNGYFEQQAGAPKPLVIRVKGRASFSEVDAMGIVWFGRYTSYFEQGFTELFRHIGLSFEDFRKVKVRAPIVQLHVDYYGPLLLDEEFTIVASLFYCEGARINIEYEVRRLDNSLAATGFTVQMLTGLDRDFYISAPEILLKCRERWVRGEFDWMR